MGTDSPCASHKHSQYYTSQFKERVSLDTFFSATVNDARFCALVVVPKVAESNLL